MTKNYGEIMNRIELNVEIKERILKNIQDKNYKTKNSSKIKNIYNIKEYLIIAACFMFLIGISIYLPDSINKSLNEEATGTKQMLEVTANVDAYDSAEQLSQSLGFEIEDINVPFEVLGAKYMSYFGELGEIDYVGENQSLIYRKSLGNYDNSGDCNEYNDIFKTTVNNDDIIIKGNDDKYVLALWTNGEYSYSIKLLNPVTKDQINNAILKKDK